MFDLRNTAAAVRKFSIAGCHAPVHSLALSSSESTLLCGAVSGMWALDMSSGATTSASLSGSCVSLCSSTRASASLCVASVRGGGADSAAAHAIFSPEQLSEPRVLLRGHAARCIMSRACLWFEEEQEEQGDAQKPVSLAGAFVAGGDENRCSTLIWSVDTGNIVQRLASHRTPVFMSQHMVDASSHTRLLASVSENELRVYHKAASTSTGSSNVSPC